MLVIWKNVPHLGRQSLPSSLAAIHWFEPSQWTTMAHEGRFLVINTINGLIKLLTTMTNINKWDSILFVHPCFHTCQIISCWWLTISFLPGPLKWIMWSLHRFMISFAFNWLGWFHLINSRRSFLMPNRRNGKIKSRIFGITSCRRNFSNKCIK